VQLENRVASSPTQRDVLMRNLLVVAVVLVVSAPAFVLVARNPMNRIRASAGMIRAGRI